MNGGNAGVVLRHRPVGLLRHDDVELVDLPMPALPDGGFIVAVDWICIDAAVRSWLQESEGYFPPVAFGEVVRSAGSGRVIATASPNFREGDVVAALTGWQRYVALPDDPLSTNLGRPEDVDQHAHLAVYSSAGMTAYLGMLEVGEAKAGETVVVSGAAGATGSIAAQLAKLQGCRVIGVAGSDEKCQWIVDELGLDGAVNYRTDDVPAALKALCPRRIDVFFDNVGGVLLDQVLARIANGARVVICGAISSYNDDHRPPGPANYLNLVHRRASMRGFLTLDHWGRFGEIQPKLQALVESGQLKFRTTVFDGLDASVDAMNSMFTGESMGRVVVKP